jgi:hypothetical protein
MVKKELINEIKEEIKNLERLEKEMNSVLSDIGEEPTFKDIRASASILHDFYSGIEKIFKRIALVIDNSLPQGENWHIELLSQMAKSFGNVRSRVVSEGLYEKLKDYLKFRHLFRHIYGFELKWERFKSIALSMSAVLDEFKENVRKFTQSLESKKTKKDKK